MTLNDSWTVMNNSSSEISRRTKHNRCCSVLLWSVLSLVAMAAVSLATVAVLHLNHYPLPFIHSTLPIVWTDPKETGALVTVSRVTDGRPISIFLEANCRDYSESFRRWEELQTHLLRTINTNTPETHTQQQGNNNPDPGQWQDSLFLMEKLHEELKLLSGHAHSLKLQADWLKRGQGSLDQRMDELLQLNSGFSESINGLQKETESLTRINTQLINGESKETATGAGKPRDCSDVMAAGFTQNGVYSIFPLHDPTGFRVYCDMITEGGGWTVFQRREDGSVDFFRDWDAYRDGFGKTTGEHWLGLQRVSSLTATGVNELRIEMADFENSTAFALYSDFSVGRDSVNPEQDGYQLFVDGYSGTAGDSLLKHSGMRFTTRDRDLDQSENNCAGFYQGAWWYRNCHTSNLNGQYLRGSHASYADGVEWSSWTGWQYSLRYTEMKIRPRN